MRRGPPTNGATTTFAALGYRVIRIWNNEVIENIDGVLQSVLSELRR